MKVMQINHHQQLQQQHSHADCTEGNPVLDSRSIQHFETETVDDGWVKVITRGDEYLLNRVNEKCFQDVPATTTCSQNGSVEENDSMIKDIKPSLMSSSNEIRKLCVRGT